MLNPLRLLKPRRLRSPAGDPPVVLVSPRGRFRRRVAFLCIIALCFAFVRLPAAGQSAEECGRFDFFCHLSSFFLFLICLVADLLFPAIGALLDLFPDVGLRAIVAIFPYFELADDWIALETAFDAFETLGTLVLAFAAARIVFKFVPGFG